MPAPRTYITTTIPYVNGRPHLGHALELVQADVLARHWRQRGEQVRFQTGTDDNSLKNVLAAQAEGIGVQEFVDRNAAAFIELAGPLSLSVDDVIRTSCDPRHRAGVERLWRACADAGDLHRRHYAGLYCVGCEQFYPEAELNDGRCPEHDVPPEPVSEENWFFALSRYAGRLRSLIETDALRIVPAERRNEVLAFIVGGLDDFSISRSVARAHGWGIPVPGDPSQVIYVWWDALGNYITALGYGTGGADYQRWWAGAQHRVHLVGKDVLRFHAVYWPAMLLSADLPLPTQIVVHDFLTADGRKISKSGGPTVDPADLAGRYGTDAVRWWLLREVPRVGDVDFTVARLVSRANNELANGIGNLVNRVVAMIHRYRDGQVPPGPVPSGRAVPPPGPVPSGGAGPLQRACREAPGLVDSALAARDFRRATSALWSIVDEANRYINVIRPWELARSEQAGDRQAASDLDAALSILILACQTIAEHLATFLPGAASLITRQCTPVHDRLPAPTPLFARLPPSDPHHPAPASAAR